MLPASTATMGAIFKDNGYDTSWFGKNHNTPDWESSVAGPFTRWPTGMGFDYFYGFIAGETNQYYPVIFENTKAVEPDKTPEQGYHFMADMTDHAIKSDGIYKVRRAAEAFRHVLRSRRGPRPSSIAPGVARQVQRAVRCRMGTSSASRPTSGS